MSARLQKSSFLSRSPFVIEDENPEENIVKVALKGTQNVFSSVVKARETVKRLILTSSVAGQSFKPFEWRLWKDVDVFDSSSHGVTLVYIV